MSRVRTSGMILVMALAASGCGNRCESYTDWYYDGYSDVVPLDIAADAETGGGWVDTASWADTGYYNWYSGYLDIGVGTRGFIEVPVGEQVSPELDSDPPYFNVALRAWAIEPRDLTIRLAALVDEVEYHVEYYDDVSMKCRSGVREVGGLQFHLDPAVLPAYRPLPTPVPDDGSGWDSGFVPDTGLDVEPGDSGFDSGDVGEDEPWSDTGYQWTETGWWWAETGYWGDAQGDVQIRATVVDANGVSTEGSTLWHIYR